jgi:3'(2'), 5'-bisphosphate nucleotidase
MPDQEREAALTAGRRAGREIMALYASFEAIADAPADISTEADRRSQEVILQHLSALFPDDAYCAEEVTPTLERLRRQGPRLWIIDPIDGSRGFARKNGEFSVMIGLVQEGEIALGVVLEPARGRCTWAERGRGCWTQEADAPAKRCQVSRTAELEQATMVRSRSEKPKSGPPPDRTVYTYSAGIKLALVARGEVEWYASDYHNFHTWDLCAGHILVEEAGGKLTDARGRPVAYRDDGLNLIDGCVASNGLVHVAALRHVNDKVKG